VAYKRASDFTLCHNAVHYEPIRIRAEEPRMVIADRLKALREQKNMSEGDLPFARLLAGT
jgi:hypothetical protein